MSRVQSLLVSAVQRLAAAGSSTSSLDAQLWLAHVCGLTRAQLLARPERAVSPEQVSRFAAGLERLAAGEPLPYLTGRAEFYGLAFRVTPATLIPRPETEHLVEAALGLIPEVSNGNRGLPIRVVDVGTGSGCVAVALAVNRPAAHLVATDVSAAALEVAAHNAQRHGVAGRISFLQGHLLEPLLDSRPGTREVHLIVANLPYVADGEWDDLPVSVREYESESALRGGCEGLDLIEELLDEAPAVLQPQGAILLEIGAAQGPAARGLAEARFPAAAVRLQRDYAGRDRVLMVQT